MRAVAPSKGAAPAVSEAADGPVVQEALGKKAPARTYPNLLRNAQDEAAFDHYATSQLGVVDFSGHFKPVGAPAVYLDASPSPDGRYMLVEATHRPGLEILDRVGGGDSFASGLVAALLDDQELATAVQWGAAHGALAMTTPGDTSMATRTEILTLATGGNARVKR